MIRDCAFTGVAMNFASVLYDNHFQELLFSKNEINHNVECKIASGSASGIISTSVFGAAGNRYSILVVEKELLGSDYAGSDGKWSLLLEKKVTVEFEHMWAVEARGSGCIVLCGREVPQRFTAPA